MSYKKQELLTIHGVHSGVLVGSVLLIFLVFCVVLLYVFTYLVQCCNVLYDFRIKTMFDSSLPPVVCRRAHILLTLFMFAVHSCVQHILCCVLLFCISTSCVLYVASFSGLSIFDYRSGIL